MNPRLMLAQVFLAAILFCVHETSDATPIQFTDMHLNQNASLQGLLLRLTPAATFSFGSAFVKPPTPIGPNGSFSSFFEFQVSEGTGGDGFVFVVQSSPQGAQALGGFGGDLGYHDSARPPGISPSIGVEFDTFQNPFDPAGEHVGIDVNGSTTSLVTAPASIRGANRFAWVDYANGGIAVFLSDSENKPAAPLLAASLVGVVDFSSVFGPQTFFGFTAATGGLTDNHDILRWDLTVPEPATLPFTMTGLLILAGFWLRARARSMRRRAVL
jgi:hypothetical protein